MAVAVHCLAAAAVADVLVLDTATTPARQIQKSLKANGVASRIEPPAEVIAEDGASTGTVWIAPEISTVPAPLAHAIAGHLRAQGSIVVVGPPPFLNLTHSLEGREVPGSVYLSHRLKRSVFLDWGRVTSESLIRSADPKHGVDSVGFVTATVPASDGTTVVSALRVDIPKLGIWATFGHPLERKLPARAATCFWAKGTSATSQLALEISEEDKSRWIATVNLKPDWQFYAVRPREFRLWAPNGLPNRGGAGDHLHTEHAGQFTVGLALTHTTVGQGPHQFEITSLSYAEESDIPPSPDFDPPAIDCLSPVEMLYPMRPARLVAGGMAPSAAEFTTPEAVVCATEPIWSSYQRPTGSGIGKQRRLRYIPVLTGINADGSRAGAAAAMVAYFGDPYAGAVYGYLSADASRLAGEAQLGGALARIVRAMETRALLAEAGTEDYTSDVRDVPAEGLSLGFRTIPMRLDAADSAAVRVQLLADEGSVLLDETVLLKHAGETVRSWRQKLTRRFAKARTSPPNCL